MNLFRTILIDDHRLFSDGMALILNNSTRFTVIGQVYDSRLACDACEINQPDLVLVDFNMPHLDGLAVVKQLQTLTLPCRIVVVSMYAEQAEITRFEALNVDGYLAKTIPADRLLTLLERVMAGERVVETDSDTVAWKPVAPPDYFRLKYQLSQRELDILNRIKQGMTSEQIAVQLHLSYHTVQTHRKNINRKLPFKTQQEFHDFLNTLDG